MFRYESTAHFIDVFRRFYGPTYKAFAALGSDRQAALAADIMQLLAARTAHGTSLAVPAEYLEVVFEVRRGSQGS